MWRSGGGVCVLFLRFERISIVCRCRGVVLRQCLFSLKRFGMPLNALGLSGGVQQPQPTHMCIHVDALPKT